MEKYKVTINNVEYEFENQLSIHDACMQMNICIPTIYLQDDINYVEVNNELIQDDTLIMDQMNILTDSELVNSFVENKIKELHAKLKTSCQTCSVINCPLKEQFNKFHLQDNGSTYKECSYYQNGTRNKILKEVEVHNGLEDLLNNPNFHKVAIIDFEASPKKGEILNKGFNEVITSDYFKKFKIVEESALFLEEIAKSLDKRPNLLPAYILEDSSLKYLVPKAQRKNIINVGSLIDIIRKIINLSLDASKIKFVYITEDNFNNENNEEITFAYLQSLPDVENLKIDNLTKQLKLVEKEVNYNSFINYLNDILKSKQTFNSDIYQLSDYEIKCKGRTIKIANIRYSDCNNADAILVLKDQAKNNTPSFIDDKDVNYIYKNYLKKTGVL